MKIALIGYGKMGKTIEKIAISRGHEIAAVFNSQNILNQEDLCKCDVAIEITRPELAKEHIQFCALNNIPIVTGTTGWYEDFEEVKKYVLERRQSLLYATNFSIGVNLFFEANKKLAAIMAAYHKEYNCSITEIHHLQKLDAPSGTAISLANDIINENKQYKSWELSENDSNSGSALPIIAQRLPEVPGTHNIKYQSEIDTIEFIHTAQNRDGFGLGAVMAAEFLQNKKGIYTMKDVLGV